MKKHFPLTLLILFIPYWTYLAFDPYERGIWWAENLPVMATVLVLILTFRKFRFSNLSYFFMAWWIFGHTYGGHYSFSLAPFDLVNDFFGWERNMFDRFGHFMIGLFALPVAELMWRNKWITKPVPTILFALFSIVTLAAFYELIEWQFAVIFGGESASDFLGSQGDVWDAQKDILMDTLGAIFSLLFFKQITKE
ncbi:MAG: DUF2238 domain-containing protein [Candidatus Peregrinibacteria bacterium]|nr:DUF2238 domain-containing protein [Candidatus Peregrinibacteria bacterium]